MPLTTDEVQQLHEALDRGEPTPWMFDEDGLRVLGISRRLEEIETKDYGRALTFVLEVDSQERRVLLTTVLKRKLQRLDIKAGEPVAIERFAEKTHPQGGTPYWDYAVRRLEDTQPQELNWGAKAALPETVDAEVLDHYEVQHLPAEGVEF